MFCFDAFATRLDDDIEKVWKNTGEIIEIGSYPQTLVKDGNLISKLNSEEKIWISYNYARGENIENGDWMKYCDVIYEKEKYRGVIFSKYKPLYTNIEVDYEEINRQNENGYSKNTVYWFKYEPIKWRVLESTLRGYLGKSVVITLTADKILDCQPFDEKLFMDENGDYYRDSEFSTPYKYSYRNSYYRDFSLNNFAKTAFTDEDYLKVGTHTHFQLDSGNDIMDNVFINHYDIKDYEFSKSIGTDYAKIQGLSVDVSGYGEYWVHGVGFTYFPGGEASCVTITQTGKHNFYGELVNSNFIGVRPYIEMMLLDSSDYCCYCEDIHDDNFFGKIVYYFHRFLYLIRDYF